MIGTFGDGGIHIAKNDVVDIVIARLAKGTIRLLIVVDVHDLHVWTLTSDMDVATVHLMTIDESDPHPVLDAARDLLADEYGISHATVQVEPTAHTGCTEVAW